MKETSILPKQHQSEAELKEGTVDIRKAYFKSWYESCKDIYNKERRKKRKEKRNGSR